MQSVDALAYRLWLSQMARFVRVLALRTARAIVLSPIDHSFGQVLAVSHAAAPHRNVGFDSLLLQLADDRRRAVASIGRCFANCDLVLFADALQLGEIGLVVMPPPGGHLGIQNDAAIGVNRLMDFVLELPWRASLLSQRGVRVGAAGM